MEEEKLDNITEPAKSLDGKVRAIIILVLLVGAMVSSRKAFVTVVILLMIVVALSWYFHAKYPCFGYDPKCRDQVYKKYFNL